MGLSAREVISENLGTIGQQVKELEDSDLKKLQQCEFEMFQEINALASANGLHLMLGGGTLLGAVRHHGFIPWDDDIDLMMMRNEVASLIQLVEDNLFDRYEIQYAHEGYEHFMSFIKIRKRNTTYIELGYEHLPNTNGVYLDVFIIENVPDNIVQRYWFGLICNFLAFLGPSLIFFHYESNIEKALYTSSCKGRILYTIRKLLGFCFSWKAVSEWYRILDTHAKKYASSNHTKRVSIPSGRRHYFGEMLPRTYFDSFALVSFEGVEAYAPVRYKEYLLNLYGETYMQVPEMKDREKHCVIDYDFTKRKGL